MIWCGQRLGQITDAQFQQALTRAGYGDFVSATPITQGLFGQNVYVTSTHGEWVLRGVPHYDWQFPHEQRYAEWLAQAGIPTPAPYWHCVDTDIFGWEFVIMPRMPGVTLALLDAHKTCAVWTEIAEAQGDMLRRIHAVPVPPAQVITDMAMWRVEYAQQIRTAVESACQHSAWTTAADVAWVEQVIATGLAAVDDGPLAVVLRDYKLENMTMMQTATGWQVTGVFDLMEAAVGHPESDSVRQALAYLDAGQPMAARQFVRATMGEAVDWQG